MESSTEVLHRALLEYFETHPESLRTLTDILRDGVISLRVLDWLVCNYSKKFNVAYVLSDGRFFNVYSEYRCQLKSYSKRLMDPFRRRERIKITDADGGEMETTVSQLNFFRWSIRYGVIQYALEHLQDIEKDMLRGMNQEKRSALAAAAKPIKRRQLSKAAIQSCTASALRVTITFGEKNVD